MAGKLIVIDGGDGAGKATQVRLLVDRLRQEGKSVETLDFPQYTQNTFGKLIRECLDGHRGDFMAVDARIASTLYAADRFETKPRIEQWLKEDKVVVLDRYVSANMMHQGAKIDDPEALKSFLGWLDHMEHAVFQIPRPDIIFYLEVPFMVRKKLKETAIAEKKHGSNVSVDLAERSDTHQAAVEERARDIVASYNNWYPIRCVDGECVRTREDIHYDVYKKVQELLTT